MAPKLREQLAKAKDSKAIAILGAARTAAEITLVDKLVQTTGGSINITLANITSKLDTKANDLIHDTAGTIPVGASRTSADGALTYSNQIVGFTGTTSGGSILTSSTNISISNEDVDLYLMEGTSTGSYSTEGIEWTAY